MSFKFDCIIIQCMAGVVAYTYIHACIHILCYIYIYIYACMHVATHYIRTVHSKEAIAATWVHMHACNVN